VYFVYTGYVYYFFKPAIEYWRIFSERYVSGANLPGCL